MKKNLYDRLAAFFERWGNRAEKKAQEREDLSNPLADILFKDWNEKEITNPHSYIA